MINMRTILIGGFGMEVLPAITLDPSVIIQVKNHNLMKKFVLN